VVLTRGLYTVDTILSADWGKSQRAWRAGSAIEQDQPCIFLRIAGVKNVNAERLDAGTDHTGLAQPHRCQVLPFLLSPSPKACS
jgi:hypothetical protein